MIYPTDPETSRSELIAKIERQCQIIADLLLKNEQMRNRLDRLEHGTQRSRSDFSVSRKTLQRK